MMKKLFFISLLLLLVSCNLEDKAKRQYERSKHDYEEFVGKYDRGEKPFAVSYQKDESAKTPLIVADCSENESVKTIYFTTPAQAHRDIFKALKNLYSFPNEHILKPSWDMRYVYPVSEYVNNEEGTNYANHAKFTGLDARKGTDNHIIGTEVSRHDAAGSVVQSKCLHNSLTAGTTLNLNDAPEQALEYAGISSSFAYEIDEVNHIQPWHANAEGNLVIQAYFDIPMYQNFENNIGGSVAFNLFLYNPKLKKFLNYVIGIYAAGEAWEVEKAGIRFDPTTEIVHVATVIKKNSWWSTISLRSKSIQEVYSRPKETTKDDGTWNNFYRVNISYQNLLAVLNELKRNPPKEVTNQNFGLNPQDWEVTSLSVQYELEEQGGKALFSGSFRGFEAYLSQKPL
ncbi:MAG: hypothetical protein DSZ09_00845 [Sulfurovum sp.]|nr:MAG: hypothetical protein DSZ09_00845 [Sulfurovum sp.]